MSGSKVNNYSTTLTSLTWMQLAIDYARPGYNAIELTNMSTTAKPAIGAGSLCECGGALYQFSTEEPISTTGISTTDQTYFIELIPSSSQCTAQFSTIIPTYRADYHGWYLNSTSNHRIVGYTVINTGNYINKNKDVQSYTFCYLSANVHSTNAGQFSACDSFSKYLDILNEWSTTTHSFTPKKSGKYSIIFSGRTESTATSYIGISINSSYSTFTSAVMPVLPYSSFQAVPCAQFITAAVHEHSITRYYYLSTSDSVYAMFNGTSTVDSLYGSTTYTYTNAKIQIIPL